eukprot:GHVQ01013004.1.p1 GENE.GHVQ01013004.1~~GHVQ01013004.1.p1  ORF type:complete len:1035 (-),score=195.64 GHVQ01013004.1:1716-4820(-)
MSTMIKQEHLSSSSPQAPQRDKTTPCPKGPCAGTTAPPAPTPDSTPGSNRTSQQLDTPPPPLPLVSSSSSNAGAGASVPVVPAAAAAAESPSSGTVGPQQAGGRSLEVKNENSGASRIPPVKKPCCGSMNKEGRSDNVALPPLHRDMVSLVDCSNSEDVAKALAFCNSLLPGSRAHWHKPLRQFVVTTEDADKKKRYKYFGVKTESFFGAWAKSEAYKLTLSLKGTDGSASVDGKSADFVQNMLKKIKRPQGVLYHKHLRSWIYTVGTTKKCKYISHKNIAFMEAFALAVEGRFRSIADEKASGEDPEDTVEARKNETHNNPSTSHSTTTGAPASYLHRTSIKRDGSLGTGRGSGRGRTRRVIRGTEGYANDRDDKIQERKGSHGRLKVGSLSGHAYAAYCGATMTTSIGFPEVTFDASDNRWITSPTSTPFSIDSTVKSTPSPRITFPCSLPQPDGNIRIPTAHLLHLSTPTHTPPLATSPSVIANASPSSASVGDETTKAPSYLSADITSAAQPQLVHGCIRQSQGESTASYSGCNNPTAEWNLRWLQGSTQAATEAVLHALYSRAANRMESLLAQFTKSIDEAARKAIETHMMNHRATTQKEHGQDANELNGIGGDALDIGDLHLLTIDGKPSSFAPPLLTIPQCHMGSPDILSSSSVTRNISDTISAHLQTYTQQAQQQYIAEVHDSLLNFVIREFLAAEKRMTNFYLIQEMEYLLCLKHNKDSSTPKLPVPNTPINTNRRDCVRDPVNRSLPSPPPPTVTQLSCIRTPAPRGRPPLSRKETSSGRGGTMSSAGGRGGKGIGRSVGGGRGTTTECVKTEGERVEEIPNSATPSSSEPSVTSSALPTPVLNDPQPTDSTASQTTDDSQTPPHRQEDDQAACEDKIKEQSTTESSAPCSSGTKREEGIQNKRTQNAAAKTHVELSKTTNLGCLRERDEMLKSIILLIKNHFPGITWEKQRHRFRVLTDDIYGQKFKYFSAGPDDCTKLVNAFTSAAGVRIKAVGGIDVNVVGDKEKMATLAKAINKVCIHHQ